MADMNDLMKMFGELSKELSSSVSSMEKERIEAESGGGMVKLTMDGTAKVLQLDIDPLLLDKENKNHLEQLLMAAFNSGREKCNTLLQKHTQGSIVSNLENPLGFKSDKE